MSAGEKRPLEEATNIARSFYELIEGYSPEILVAGSIRRKKPQVGDIEIVAMHDERLLQRLDVLVAEGTITKASYGPERFGDGERYGGSNFRWGDRFRGCMFQGMKVEVFTFDQMNRGGQILIRTGPGDANTAIMTMLARKRAPYRFQGGYVWHAKHWERNARGEWDADDKRLIPVKDEEMIFKLLGINYADPQDRSEEKYMRGFSKSMHTFGDCPHVCEICTGRVWTDEPDLLDTTAKSASTDEGRVLAPPWEIVMGSKNGELSWEQYTERYLEILRGRWRSHPELFLNILKRDRVVIGCYCEAGKDQCHRHLVVDVLKKIAAAHNILIVDGGEVQPKVKQMELF